MEIGVLENLRVVENLRWVNFFIRKVIIRIRSDWIKKYCEKLRWWDCLVEGEDLRVWDYV